MPAPAPLSRVLLAKLTNLSAVAFDMGRAGFAPDADSGSRVEVNTDTATAVTLTALRPSAPVWLDGAPVGTTDANGGATVGVPVGEHTITVLPEPSTPLGIAAGATLMAAFSTRRSRG